MTTQQHEKSPNSLTRAHTSDGESEPKRRKVQHPEETSSSLDCSLQLGDRVVRVEAIVAKLLKSGSNGSESNGKCEASKAASKEVGDFSRGPHTPTSISSHSSQFLNLYKPPVDEEPIQYEILDGNSEADSCSDTAETFQNHTVRPGRYERLSQVLYESLPSPEDADKIANARGNTSSLFYQMLTMPYDDLDRLNHPNSVLLNRPSPNAHPVLIGRYMLQIATFLQHLHPDLHSEIRGLSEPPRQLMKRLADIAINFVTTNDDLIGSVEGLECIMMESMYQSNGGNLRKALIAIRRAIVIAQLMGFHRTQSRVPCKIAPETKSHPEFIWFHILFAERHLCLMLGLPESTRDHSMASDKMLASDTPMGRLERIHCVIASRILERNQSDPSSQDFSLTQELDGQLQSASEGLPKKWWLTVNLAILMDQPKELFWAMRRLFHQLFHYNLLNQLHLPYMLCSSSSSGQKYDYSRMTCITASREVLSRFIMFRSVTRIAFWCRTIDFFSLLAAMTLLIAHLDGHRRCAASQSPSGTPGQHPMAENLLIHQRPGDRAMIEQVQENMEEVSKLNNDPVGAQSADLLRRLLAIEADAAGGHTHQAATVSIRAPGVTNGPAGELRGNTCDSVRVFIPYFGTVKISREGGISKERSKGQRDVMDRSEGSTARAPESTTPDSIPVQATPPSLEVENSTKGVKAQSSIPANMETNSSGESLSETEAGKKERPCQSTIVYENPILPQELSPSLSPISHSLLQQNEYPHITAGVDNWAFQGVDMAFFDSLMRGTTDYGNEGSEWLSWPDES
ncbi:hypothetical protein BX600DRAFT_435219 [Xylariales sp. PMI_506]|nr:hypothetical protein BX600DRAFT_435219 [Xylariales sp. PMI_506]